MPMMERKNEYQSRVSPIVRIGGRSNSIHMPMMKRKKTAEPKLEHAKAPFRRFLKDKKAPATQHTTDAKAYMTNESQFIFYPPLSF
jgi:hypothetical protein